MDIAKGIIIRISAHMMYLQRVGLNATLEHTMKQLVGVVNK